MIACKNEMRRYTWAFPTKCGSLSSITNKSYNLSNHLINHFSSKTKPFPPTSGLNRSPILFSWSRLQNCIDYAQVSCIENVNAIITMHQKWVVFLFCSLSSFHCRFSELFFGYIQWREKKASSHKFHRHLELFRTNYNIYARIFVSRSMHWRMRHTTHKH